MDIGTIRQILKQVEKKSLSVNAAMQSLKHLPYEDLSRAKIDHHRAMRTDIPEVIFAGRKKIVLGARSAVLTPVRNLRLLIVDEEHETSYKQDDRLRYNARDTALMRGKTLGIPVLLGSATPSLQTVYRTRLDQYRALALPSRIFNRPQPEFEVVDIDGNRIEIRQVA